MKYTQKNIFGNNIIYTISPNFTREMEDEIKSEIISTLTKLEVTSVSIRFEYSSETIEFVEKIRFFLHENGYIVYTNSIIQSEINRYELSIQKHPSDQNFAILCVGTLI